MILPHDWRVRATALAAISSVELVAWATLPSVPANDWYFAVCAAFNLITLLLLSVTKRCQIVVDLAVLSFVQLMCQFFGWVMYSAYFPSDFYNWSIFIIVAVTYARVFWIGKSDGNRIGNPEASVMGCIFYSDYNECLGDTFKVHQ